MEICDIGIFGGSFDPVHRAHMLLAEAAFRQCAFGALLFVPARQAALRGGQTAAPAADRLAMLEIAVSKLAFPCEIETCELSRGGISYSIDTAEFLRAKYPAAKLHWIIGGDHIAKLAQWRDISRLSEIVDFVCARRPGCAVSAGEIPAGAKVRFIDFDPLDISSTNIRRMASLGEFSEAMLDRDVISYIKKHKLYQ